MQLIIEQVSKTYSNGVKAIDKLSLELCGGMFGLLGPNGAGKSTLMRTIATLQTADSGQILFEGKNIFNHKTEFRKSLGYLPQDFGVYPRDSAEQLLNYFAVLKGISSKQERGWMVDAVLEQTNLSEVRKKRVSTFSGGMKQRFGIAQLLLNRPKVIIVDEPTAGLDPAERTRFLNVLRNIGTNNIVLFSTHIVEDVQALCSEMAIIDRGTLRANSAPRAAVARLEGKIWEASVPSIDLHQTEEALIQLSSHYNEKDQLVFRVYAEKQPSPQFRSVGAKLEDYYFLSLNQ